MLMLPLNKCCALLFALQPGLPSAQHVRDGTAAQYMHQYSDPQKTFPIPNEKKKRMAVAESSTSSGSPRKIAFKGSDPTVGRLPVKPPGPTWNGRPCITRSQLEAHGRKMITRSMEKGKKSAK